MSLQLAQPCGDGCFSGVKHTGTPVGAIVALGGIDTYLSEPPTASHDHSTTKNIILFLADIWSPLFINNKLLQDSFAASGFTVLGPDYFFGDAITKHEDPGFDKATWMANARTKALAAFPAWLEAVKEKYGTVGVHYHAVGYCFGAPFALDLGRTGFVAAVAIAHPTYVNEDHLEQLKAPVLLSCAETDHTFPRDARRRAEDILVEKKHAYHLQVFSGVAHGFAVRANLDVENERWAKEESARSVIGWFERFSK
ncbi:hypothetical protein PLICRDRAFT_375986 [Plicaturopsis crispa FD-325 SS-3]|nr:hypothetical protein PLICRDRAFT_375986 [Plicaturopsis crispa FD-325 SS-3]